MKIRQRDSLVMLYGYVKAEKELREIKKVIGKK
jgi:hypothetical protein